MYTVLPYSVIVHNHCNRLRLYKYESAFAKNLVKRRGCGESIDCLGCVAIATYVHRVLILRIYVIFITHLAWIKCFSVRMRMM